MTAVNEELQAEGLTGLTLVNDSDLQETVEAAAKVPELEKKVTDLDAEKVLNLATITDLQKVVAEQKKELGKPEEDAKPPVSNEIDSTGKPAVVNKFETSFDREFKARFK